MPAASLRRVSEHNNILDGLSCCDGTEDLLRAPGRRAPETLHRRPFAGVAIPPELCGARRLSVPARSTCFFPCAVWRIGGKRRKGESHRLRDRGRRAQTASQNNGSPVPAAFSLLPYILHQSRASRRCANPRTRKCRLSASRGPKFSN